jgi:large subunit ribosomal protein L29
MFRLRFQLSMGQQDGVKKIRELRKDRARILTLLKQRGEKAPALTAPVVDAKGAKKSAKKKAATKKKKDA